MATDEATVKVSKQLVWLEKEIVPKIALSLGKDAQNMRCEIRVLKEVYSISSIYITNLIFGHEGEQDFERLQLVIKVPPEAEAARNCMRTDFLFHNEIIFYRRFALYHTDYPKCVFIEPEPIAKAVIAIENVKQFGYEHLPSKEDMGMKRALTVFKEFGKFHARGYVLKEQNPEEFFDLVENIRETKSDDTAHPVIIEFINKVSQRPVNYLRTINYDPVFCDKISTVLSDTNTGIFQDCRKPRNELVVLCHGDSIANNILFKENENGEVRVKFLDFAQIRYGSPALDFSTFLYHSCDDKVRKNFSVLFRAYHDTVLEYLEEQGIQDLGKYSYEGFLKDYKRHAVFGGTAAICFKPLLYCDYPIDFEYISENLAKYIENVLLCGGDMVSKMITEYLLELRQHGCLDHLI